MQGKWWDSMAAIEAMTEVMKTSNVNSHGILTVFDSADLALVQRDGLIGEWPAMQVSPLAAHWGGTPLYDAINLMGRELAALAPTKCSIVIVTDGDENGSTHTSPAQAKAILDWCRAQGWQVTFLGAEFNNSRQSALLGATPQNSIGVQQTKMIEAGKALGRKRVHHAHSDTPINFTDDEKTDFGGYLMDHSNGK